MAYHVSKQEGLPLTMWKISEILELDLNALFTSYKEIKKGLKLNNPLVDYSSLVLETGNKLGLSEGTTTLAIKELSRLDGVTDHPRVKAGKAILKACQEKKENTNKTQIARTLGISEGALKH